MQIKAAPESCCRCRKKFTSADLIEPVFAVIRIGGHTYDVTDPGIELDSDVQFAHQDCSNTTRIFES